VLYIDQENHMLKKMSQNSGAKIVVHDPALSPLLDEFAIDLQPGAATSIAMQVVSLAVEDTFNSINLNTHSPKTHLQNFLNHCMRLERS